MLRIRYCFAFWLDLLLSVKDFFNSTSVHDRVIEVLTFATKEKFKKSESFKIYLMPTVKYYPLKPFAQLWD